MSTRRELSKLLYRVFNVAVPVSPFGQGWFIPDNKARNTIVLQFSDALMKSGLVRQDGVGENMALEERITEILLGMRAQFESKQDLAKYLAMKLREK